jgi:hypothetical protein
MKPYGTITNDDGSVTLFSRGYHALATMTEEGVVSPASGRVEIPADHAGVTWLYNDHTDAEEREEIIASTMEGWGLNEE